MSPPLDIHQPHQGAPYIRYVLKVYPRFSKTFIVTEILAREIQDEDLSICAPRPTTDARLHPEIARAAVRVNWVGRPNRAIDLRSQLIEGLTCQEGRKYSAAIMPTPVKLPGDVVIQDVELVRQACRDFVIHLYTHPASSAGWVVWITSALAGIPYIVTTHAKDIFHESVDPAWLCRICSDAQRVIAISHYNEDYLGTVLADTEATVSLRCDALESDRLSYHVPQPMPATRAKPLRVCTVGRLVPKRGLVDLVEAVRILVGSGIDVEMELAGDGDECECLTEQIECLGLADRIHLLGPLTQAEVHELLACSDVFAIPCVEVADGNIDGLSTIVLEVAVCGTPVVATAVSGLPEMVHDSVTGVLLPPGDPASLAVALHGIIQGKVDIIVLSRGVRALIKEQLDSRAQAAVLAARQSGPVPASGVHLVDQEGAA